MGDSSGAGPPLPRPLRHRRGAADGADRSDRRKKGQPPDRRRGRGGVMKTASVAEMKSRFGAVLKASETGPVVVTRNGRPVAVIVGVEDKDEAERLVMA